MVRFYMGDLLWCDGDRYSVETTPSNKPEMSCVYRGVLREARKGNDSYWRVCKAPNQFCSMTIFDFPADDPRLLRVHLDNVRYTLLYGEMK